MVTLPRILVAAPASGSGKTTITTGLMAALRASGDVVSPHKVGPDYIDPGFHAMACGRPGRNLDPWLCGEDQIVPLLLRGATVPTPASIAVIEGVMGLFDGRLGTDGFASSAHIAALTQTPVVLVADASHASRSVAALVHGMATFDARVRVGGVILNKVGSDRHDAEIRRALESVGIPVLGSLRRDAQIEHPERHLGLVPAEESGASEALVEALAARIAGAVDLDAVRELARTAPDLDAEAWSPTVIGAPVSGAPVVAVAGGRAFTFKYRETIELLEAGGCRVVEVDPLTDAGLPDRCQGLYLGGGFPEVHAAELASNASFAASVRAAVAAGMPTVAECAGLLYLGATLDGTPMSGALGHTSAMHTRLAMGYREATAPVDTLLCPAGSVVHGHEFHRTRVASRVGDPAWAWDDADDGVSVDPSGCGRPTVHASYLHLNWAGEPSLARAFVDAVAACRPMVSTTSATEWVAEPIPSPLPEIVEGTCATPEDLHHHGDKDIVDGGLNFSVNVHADGPPRWLADAIAAANLTVYPNPDPAREALAAHHGLETGQVLPTAGAAEAFTLVARTWAGKRWCMVHPQFTEPEAALTTAGAFVHRHVLADPFTLDVDALIAEARTQACEVIMIGNPTNPTSVLHNPATLEKVIDAGFRLVVDEAFLDADEGNSMLRLVASTSAATGRAPVVVRSLTKIWGIPGIRAGWLASDPQTVEEFARFQPPWSVSAQAIAAMIATSTPEADADARRRTDAVEAPRRDLTMRLADLGLHVIPDPAAPFVLVNTGLTGSPREEMAELGIAVRRGETFPGLGPSWIRLAVRTPHEHHRLAEALAHLIDKEGSR